MKEFKIRTNYIINPSFQLRFILYYLLVSIMALMIFYITNLLFFKTLVQEGQELNLSPDHVYFSLISTQQMLMNKMFAIGALVFFVLVSVFGVFISHRIAGPIYKMTKRLNEFNSLQEVEEINFRKKDFFMELSESFNGFIKKIK